MSPEPLPALYPLDGAVTSPDNESPGPHSRPRRRPGILLDPASPALTVAGCALVTAGFALIGVGWFDVSGQTDVALQLPYLVSAALTGLGLIVVGVAMVAVAAKRQDSDERIRKMERLEALLHELGRRPPPSGADAGTDAGPDRRWARTQSRTSAAASRRR